ncbi:MAG: cyclic nucleotide-binding domain-containing protein [Terracidiphilus sp.]|jgi:CRP-like cAMP-binding protein
MNASTPQGKTFDKIDPASFLADPELVRELRKHATPVPCHSDRVLFRQDDPSVGAYILYDGGVTLSLMAQDGRSLFAVQASPGSVIGLPGAISNKPYSLSATALAGAQVSFISREGLTNLMNSEPLLALKLLEVLAAEVRAARKAIL